MPPADAVEAFQEADEAVQQDPVPAAAHPSARPLAVDVPVALPIGHPPGSSGRQQQEAGPPELQRVDQAAEAEGTTELHPVLMPGQVSEALCAHLKSSEPAEQMYWSR